MAHNIAFDKMFGEVNMGTRTRAWHNLGQTWDTPKGAVESLRLIGGDFKILKNPISVHIESEFGTMLQPIDDKFALMREPIPDDPNWQYLGVVGSRYEVIQNIDIANYLEPLTELWGVETVGILGKGSDMFMTLSLGDWDIKGEAIQEYFLAHNSSDGLGGLTLGYTPVRVVCQNTLTMGKNQATIKTTLAHRAGINDDVEFRMNMMRDLQKSQLAGRESFNAMAEAILKEENIRGVLADLYPMPKQPKRVEFAKAVDTSSASEGFHRLLNQAQTNYENARDSVMSTRKAVESLFYKHNDEHPQTAETVWAFYNAAVEHADFRDSGGKGDQWASALFGLRAAEKAKAFDMAYAMVR